MKIIGIDDQGTAEGAAGFLIFSDLARLAYARAPLADIGGPQWQLGGPGTTTWPPVTDAHHDLALAHLTEHGTKVPE